MNCIASQEVPYLIMSCQDFSFSLKNYLSICYFNISFLCLFLSSLDCFLCTIKMYQFIFYSIVILQTEFCFQIIKRKRMFPDRRGDREKNKRRRKRETFNQEILCKCIYFQQRGKKSEFLIVNSSIIYMYQLPKILIFFKFEIPLFIKCDITEKNN